MINNNKFTIDEYKDRIITSFPKWNFEIIEFNGYKESCSIKCLNCNNIYSFSKADKIMRRINACKCTKTFKDFHEKIKYLGEQYNFEIIQDGPATEKKVIKCKKCGKIMQRALPSILLTPWHCDNCNNYAKGRIIYKQEDVQKELDDKFNYQYELLEYSGMTKKALLKHLNCGKIFTIRELGDLFDGRNRGCPNCYQFKSVGEQKIKEYLEVKNISYIPQKTFSPLNKSKYRFDFYLPDYNIAIEYQGEQHYRDNGYFKEKLEIIQKRDEVKRQYCKNNNIFLKEIKYTELKQINHILDSMFNDYLEREQGLSKLETDT